MYVRCTLQPLDDIFHLFTCVLMCAWCLGAEIADIYDDAFTNKKLIISHIANGWHSRGGEIALRIIVLLTFRKNVWAILKRVLQKWCFIVMNISLFGSIFFFCHFPPSRIPDVLSKHTFMVNAWMEYVISKNYMRRKFFDIFIVSLLS